MKQKSISIIVLVAFLLGISLLSVPAQAQIKLTYANFPPAPTFPCVQMEEWKNDLLASEGYSYMRDTTQFNAHEVSCLKLVAL
jgi:hypothetical protein